MKEQLSEYLKIVIQNTFKLSLEDIRLDTPPKADMGDLSFGCFVLAKDLKKPPQDIAGDLKIAIDSDENKKNFINKVSVEGAYLNIFLNANTYAISLEKMLQDDLYQGLKGDDSKTIYIDYIGANVGKPLHIGHMCTPVQGQVLINLFKKLEYNVISDSHIGDWGIIFGKLIIAYQKYGDRKELEKNAVEHLFELYVRISALAEEDDSLEEEFRSAFKLLSEGDSDMMQIWAIFTRKSIDAMNVLLNRLFVFPKYNIGESFYEGLGLEKMEDYPDLTFSMRSIVDELLEKGIATQNDDGSVGVEFPEEMKIPSCILQKRDGTHGYLASDLASVKYRMSNWEPEKILYFVDVRQQLHLKQTFVISKMAQWIHDDETEITHAHNGFISLKDGAMSTRKGKIIKLEDLLNEGQSRAAKIISEKRPDMSGEDLNALAEVISLGAIKYGYLKKTRESDSVFDWDEYMSFEGNSGPYIQYAYVRAQKILAGNKQNIEFSNLRFESEEEKRLIAHILKFTKVIKKLSETYHPHLLCNYTYEMTKLFSSFYANIPVLSEKNTEVRRSRLALMQAFSRVIEESFSILGIPLPKEM